MRLDPVLGGERGHVGQAAQLDSHLLAAPCFLAGMGIFAGVQLDHWCAQFHRGFDLAFLGSDEQADADASIAEPCDDRRKPVVLPGGIEPALGRPLLAPFGDDAGGVRHMAQRDGEHLVGRRHFEVERQIGRGLDPREVFVADVAAVFAQVRRNPVAATFRDNLGRTHRIGMIAAARVADRRHVIDVHAQSKQVGMEPGRDHAAPCGQAARLSISYENPLPCHTSPKSNSA